MPKACLVCAPVSNNFSGIRIDLYFVTRFCDQLETVRNAYRIVFFTNVWHTTIWSQKSQLNCVVDEKISKTDEPFSILKYLQCSNLAQKKLAKYCKKKQQQRKSLTECPIKTGKQDENHWEEKLMFILHRTVTAFKFAAPLITSNSIAITIQRYCVGRLAITKAINGVHRAHTHDRNNCLSILFIEVIKWSMFDIIRQSGNVA